MNFNILHSEENNAEMIPFPLKYIFSLTNQLEEEKKKNQEMNREIVEMKLN